MRSKCTVRRVRRRGDRARDRRRRNLYRAASASLLIRTLRLPNMPRLLLPLLLLTLACSSSVAPLRNDEPGAAAQYHAMLRAGSDDPHRDYAVAREAMRHMPRYSTASDRLAGGRIASNDFEEGQ